MNRKKTKILLISASAKTGGGPSHIFLLKEILKDEFDFYLAMPSFNFKSNQFDIKKYLMIAERKILLKDIISLVIFFRRNSIDIIHAHGKGAGVIGRIIKIFLRKPLIYTFHGVHTTCLNRLKKYLYIQYENSTGWLDNEKVFVSLSEKLRAINLKIIIGQNNRIINNITKKMKKTNFEGDKNNLKIGINNKKEEYNFYLQISYSKKHF